MTDFSCVSEISSERAYWVSELFYFAGSAVLLLGVLVFVHEAGHFLCGRFFGIGVETFSLGFGPALLKVRRRGTCYQVGTIPLGGYVKFYGTTDADSSENPDSGIRYDEASVLARSLTLLAGPLSNFLFAVLLFTGMVVYGIPQLPAVMGSIRASSPAAQAGLQVGDRVLTINDEGIDTWETFQKAVASRPDEKLRLKIDRGGELFLKEVTTSSVMGEDFLGREGRIGVIGVSPHFHAAVLRVDGRQSIAAKAGLKNGDTVLAVNQTKIGRLDELAALLNEQAKIGNVDLSIRRLGESSDRQVRLDLKNFDGSLASLGLDYGGLTVIRSDDPEKLKVGDVLLSWNGQAVPDFFALSQFNQENKLSRVRLGIERDFEVKEIEVDMRPVEVQKPKGVEILKVVPADFSLEMATPQIFTRVEKNPLMALWYGLSTSTIQAGHVLKTLGLLLTGQFPLKALGGPMMIAKVAGDSAERGAQVFLFAMALISLNLAVVNLFPIPVLDGGQLLLCLIEAVRRRKPSMELIESFQKVGFVMVMCLLVLATYNDLSRFWSSILKKLGGLF